MDIYIALLTYLLDHPCSGTPKCKRKGICKNFGCSYTCACPDLVFGPRCEHGKKYLGYISGYLPACDSVAVSRSS